MSLPLTTNVAMTTTSHDLNSPFKNNNNTVHLGDRKGIAFNPQNAKSTLSKDGTTMSAG